LARASALYLLGEVKENLVDGSVKCSAKDGFRMTCFYGKPGRHISSHAGLNYFGL
jgi:hypothetical protein